MLIGPQNLAIQLTEVRSRINDATRAAGRDPSLVTLVAVTKTRPASTVREAAALGVTDVGENYVQEAVDKMDALSDLRLTWHFIGALQSNKTRVVAERFAWVHGIDRLKVAQRLSEQRPFHAPPLNVCIQVELVPEDTKSGVEPGAVRELALRMAELPRLRLRGLMCIPPPAKDATGNRPLFERLAALKDALNSSGLALDTLSMGMSDDYVTAIGAGATMVRIGSAIFGPR